MTVKKFLSIASLSLFVFLFSIQNVEISYSAFNPDPAAIAEKARLTYLNNVEKLYEECNLLEYNLSLDVFAKAYTGYNNLAKIGKLKQNELLTIIDFSKVSTQKRLYVINLKEKKILFHSLVAHGKNSGENKAEYFSNLEGSLMSSLGFFVTAETYFGDHDYSLKLDGTESFFNSNARKRAIVIHSADYVSDTFIAKEGRLGRSHGCPALPNDISKPIIDLIAGGSCLFIYSQNLQYLNRSTLLNTDIAAQYSTIMAFQTLKF